MSVCAFNFLYTWHFIPTYTLEPDSSPVVSNKKIMKARSAGTVLRVFQFSHKRRLGTSQHLNSKYICIHEFAVIQKCLYILHNTLLPYYLIIGIQRYILTTRTKLTRYKINPEFLKSYVYRDEFSCGTLA